MIGVVQQPCGDVFHERISGGFPSGWSVNSFDARAMWITHATTMNCSIGDIDLAIDDNLIAGAFLIERGLAENNIYLRNYNFRIANPSQPRERNFAEVVPQERYC